MATKPRDGEATKAGILAAAQTQFGEQGFERTTIRSVATAASVDPALVMHYFGNKAGLFAAATRLDIRFPDLTGVAPADIAALVIPRFVEVWRPDGSFLPLLRAAATNRSAADALLEVFAAQVAPALADIVPDRPAERAALIGAQLLGVAVSRHILGTPPLAQMSVRDLVEWLGPVLAHFLTCPAPATGGQSGSLQ